jgi:hypothetical protein
VGGATLIVDFADAAAELEGLVDTNGVVAGRDCDDNVGAIKLDNVERGVSEDGNGILVLRA